jgi:hypothetical protein
MKSREIDKNEIDTSEIFPLHQDQWKNYNLHFLQITVQDALKRVLLKNDVIININRKGDDGYFEHISKKYFSFQPKENAFPLLDYYVAGDKVITYDIRCIVKRADAYYALFFALKLSLIDPMQVKGFLSYQHETYFESDLISFQTYLQDLVVTYNKIINQPAKKITTSFFEHYESNKKLKEDTQAVGATLPSTGEEAEETDKYFKGLSTTSNLSSFTFY